MSDAQPLGVRTRLRYSEAPEQTSIDIMRLLRRLLCRPHILLPAMLIGVFAGCVLLSLIAPRYSSSAQILIDPKSPTAFGAASDFANLLVDSARVESVLTVLQSTLLLKSVVISQHLADDPEFAGNRPDLIKMLLNGSLTVLHLRPKEVPAPETADEREGRALGRLAHALKVSRVGVTYVVEVSVTASTPSKAKALTQAVADAYLDEQTRSKAAAAQRDYAWLSSRLDETRNDLKTNEEAVEAVRRKFGLADIDTESQSKTDQQAVQEINRQLLDADAVVAARRAKYEQAAHVLNSGGDVGALPEAQSSPLLIELLKQRDTILQRLEYLTSHYTEAFPDLSETRRSEQSLENAIRAEGARLVANLHNDYEAAVVNRKALADELDRQTNEAHSPTKSAAHVELRDAERAAAANRTLFQTLLGKLHEVEQQIARHDPEARIISPASEPDSPSFPKPILFLAGGGLLGMMGGAGLALMRPLAERGFLRVADVETRLSLPVLGALPEIRRHGQTSRRKPANITSYVVSRPHSQYVECLRALRIALRLGGIEGPRTIQVTSAIAGEGKSAIAAALAISAALSGLRTALVDVDIRRPSIAGLFGIKDSLGLTDVLQDNLPASEARHVHRRLPLTIIPIGSVECPAPDLLASERFESVIRTVARDHDLVILDSAPALAVSDPLAVAKVADATLLVVQSRRVPKPVVEQAVRALRKVDVPLIGIAFNKVENSGAGQHPYGYRMYETYGSSPRNLASS